MDNIYIKSTELSWKKIIKYYLLVFFIEIIFIIMKKEGLLIEANDILNNMLITIFCVITSIQVANPKLSNCVISELKFRKKPLKAIKISFISSIIMRFIIDIIQNIPTIVGKAPINIASGQVDMSTFTILEKFLVGITIGPFTEELIYRVIVYTGIAYFFSFIDSMTGSKVGKKVFNIRSSFCWMLIIANSILFSMAHVPDASNFFLYFICGVVYNVVYINYGFCASWICHGLFNFIDLDMVYKFISIIY